MTEAQWAFSVRDKHGRLRRGRVSYSDRPDSISDGPGSFTEFLIVILAESGALDTVPAGTAVCVPKPRKLHALPDLDATKLPSRLRDLTFRPHRMTEYATGRIIMPPPLAIAASEVFSPKSEHPRLDLLALVLLEAGDAEALAPFTALIRHELKLPSGSDALAELGTRLSRRDPKTRLPPRAPAVMRLVKSLGRLRRAMAPEGSLEEMADDLRFLRLFNDGTDDWPGQALDRLLADVQGARPESQRKGSKNIRPNSTPAKIRPARDRTHNGPPVET